MVIPPSILDDYKNACVAASDALEYHWHIGKQKLIDLIGKLELLESSSPPIGGRMGNVNFKEVTKDMRKTASEIDKQFDRIRDVVIHTKEDDSKITNFHFTLVKTELDVAKTNILLALQGFVTGGETTPSGKQEIINFLWNNFTSINQTNRCKNEPNYLNAKKTSPEALEEWQYMNDRHLLSPYHEVLKAIVMMRNLTDHHVKNPFAREVLTKLGRDDIEDPLVGLPGVPINIVDLIASIILEISGTIRIIQIFLDTIEIVNRGGLDKSEPPRPTL